MKLLQSLGFITVTLAVVANVQAGPAQSPARPNMLIIMADDCTYNDLPAYGGPNARTPNLDSLASQGLVFNRAYLCMSICQPCRSELYTGQFPLRNGCAWKHAASRPTTQSLPEHVGRLGYRVGIAGKTDITSRKCFPFEDVPGFDDNCVRRCSITRRGKVTTPISLM